MRSAWEPWLLFTNDAVRGGFDPEHQRRDGGSLVEADRVTGSAAPGKIGGHKVGILSGEHRDWLLEQAMPDLTLRGWSPSWRSAGVKVDYVQVWRFVHAEGLSFKNVWLAPSARGFSKTA